MAIQNIGVIGAGQMGTGIAHFCAVAGYEVQLVDIDQARVEKGLATIDGNMVITKSLQANLLRSMAAGSQAPARTYSAQWIEVSGTALPPKGRACPSLQKTLASSRPM